jgi:hypothetical protein
MKPKEVTVPYFDYHQFLFAYMNSNGHLDIAAQRHDIANRIIAFYTNTLVDYDGTDGIMAKRFLTILQTRLEKEMERIISSKCVYYWFHLYRRIPPVASFGGESKMTVWLYRDILECAFRKYGAAENKTELLASKNADGVCLSNIASGLYEKALCYFNRPHKPDDLCTGIFLGQFVEEDLLSVYSLESIAHEYWYTTSCYRRICKGGILHISEDKYWVENDEKTKRLMKSYDTRNWNFDDLASSDGLPVKSDEHPGLKTIIAKYNVEQFSLEEFPIHIALGINIAPEYMKDFRPNFIWLPIDFSAYLKDRLYYSEAFRNKFGYGLVQFVYIVYLIMYREHARSLGNHQMAIDNLKRAYRHVISIESLAEDLLQLYNDRKDYEKYNITLAKHEIIDALNDLSLPYDRTHISLETLGPKYLIYPAMQNDFIIDYASVLPILVSKMHYLHVEREEKGHKFEDVVINRLQAKGINLWECKKEMRFDKEAKIEIDISFMYKGFMFLGELKTYKMSLSYIRGDSRSLEYRMDELKDALAQVQKKAIWLKQHRKGNNYNIPKDIISIVPFVVTPFTEYIWDSSETLWLSDDIPRICTPTECTHLCNDEVIHYLANKPYIVYLE